MDAAEEAALMEAWPEDAALVAWFREGHAALVRALEAAPPDLACWAFLPAPSPLACWAFLPAPSPLAFWARRQAHETAIHRADAESAGGPITAFPPAFAVDGIDELLFGFLSRPRKRLRADPPCTLYLSAADAAREWLVRVGPERVEVRSEDGIEVRSGDGDGLGAGDCSVRGSASDLYLLLWNRPTPEGLAVRGDATLLDLWRQAVRIRWS
jgi:uncharacterized protein (TIGR03083 family)